ncbi:MAG: response regulator [Bacteroidota bacterium]
MKRFLLLLLCVGTVFTVYGNNTYERMADSLRTVVPGKSGEARVDVLNDLAYALVQTSAYSEAEKFAYEAFDLAERLSYDMGLANAQDNIGLVFQSKYDYTNAMKQFVGALKMRNKISDQKGIAASKNNIGKIFFLQEDTESAIENLNAALELRKEVQDMEGAAETHRNLGDVYLLKKFYGKAKDHYRQSMEIKIALNNLEGAADIASFLGGIVSDLGDDEGSLVYFNMSLDLNNSIGNTAAISKDYYNISKSLMRQESYEEALEANDMSFRIRKKNNDKLGIAQCYFQKGMIFTQMEDKNQAEMNLEKSTILLKELGFQPGIEDIYKGISEAYVEMKNYNKAYEYQVAYSTSRDQIYTEDKSRALLELTTKYESEFAAEKQKQRIESLEQEKVFNARQRYFMYALLGLGALLLMVMYRSYTRKQKDNELLRRKNTEINQQKEEIDQKNDELKDKNASLDNLNQKLVKEMAERESIERSSFARDRFLATMSHEMRTPMNIIIGLTHLLLEEEPRPDQAEHLRTLQFSANNLVVFINDVLDFSKIEAGKLTLESRVFDPIKTFNDLRHRFKLPAKDKGLQLNYQIDRKIPERLTGDPTRLNQIMTNLLGYSIQNTDSGSVDVVVQLKEMNKKEAVIKLEVRNTDNGISQERLDEMFRQRSEGNSNDIFEGYDSSGFGLTITKRLVDLQNGKIEVDSKVGEGTVFTIMLPYKIAEEVEKKKRTVDSKEADYSHLSGNKILLVEDNKINQLVVAKLLRKLGVEVITADNGFEALDAFEDSYFDLVLMDIQMPGMDGYRATAEIRKSTDPRKRDVPIIALTASAFLTEKEKAKLFGMNDHVGKPFGPDDLLEKITNCLSVYKT